MSQIHLWPEEFKSENGKIQISARLEVPKQDPFHLWFRLPEKLGPLITHNSDPLTLVALPYAMQLGHDLHIHGEVSPSLLMNLTEFQTIWACWKPDRYRRINVIADLEQEPPRAINDDQAILAFSGGVDSCFTALRHSKGRNGRFNRSIKAGLMVHGFDIPLSADTYFNRASKASEKLLSSLGIQLFTLATNVRVLPLIWGDVHACAIAASLILFQKSYRNGLVASSYPYQNLLLPWGSNPVSDSFLGSETFRLIHDGASFTRVEKIREIGEWAEARKYLRVCWKNKEYDRNCCRCDKCVRTILAFRSLGFGLPEAFDRDITNQDIRELVKSSSDRFYLLESMKKNAHLTNQRGSWVKVLDKMVRRNQRRNARQKTLSALKELVRSFYS